MQHPLGHKHRPGQINRDPRVKIQQEEVPAARPTIPEKRYCPKKGENGGSAGEK